MLIFLIIELPRNGPQPQKAFRFNKVDFLKNPTCFLSPTRHTGESVSPYMEKVVHRGEQRISYLSDPIRIIVAYFLYKNGNNTMTQP